MLRILTAIGIGIGLGGIVAAVVGPPGAASWAIPVGLVCTIFGITFVLIARATGKISLPSPVLVESARTAGRIGVARIDTLTQTGTRINDQPVCDLQLTVQPANGAAYRTQLRLVVAMIDIPGVQAGTHRSVAILAEGKPNIALLPDDPRSSVFAGIEVPPAAQAGPLLTPEAGGLRDDGTRRTSLLSTNRATRPWRVLLYVTIGIVATALVLLPYRVGLVQTAHALSTGQLKADLRQPDYLPDAIDALVHEVGHPNAISIVVTNDYIYYTAPVSVGARESDVWTYRGGTVQHRGPANIQPENADEQFPVTEMSWRAIWPGLENAAKLVNADDLSDTHINIDRSHVENVSSDDYLKNVGPVKLQFAINTPYQDHWFTMNGYGGDLVLTNSS